MKKFRRHIVSLILCCLALQTSAEEWIKIGVTETGFHYIPGTLLTKWGIASPKEVRIFGYGCGDGSDDMPQIQTMEIDGGLLFFAVGPVRTNLNNDLTPSITTNPYSTKAYYFLTTDQRQPLDFQVGQQTSISTDDAKTYAVTWHQSELFSPGKTGMLLVGEDFTRQSNQTFAIPTPGAVPNSEATVMTRFIAKSIGGSSTLKINATGFEIQPIEDIRYDFGTMISPTIKTACGDNVTVNLSITSAGQLRRANLDYVAVAYPCNLSADNQIFFSKGGRIEDSNHLIFDITNPQQIKRINSNQLEQSSDFRCYQAIMSVEKLPVPNYESVIENQDIHTDFSLPQMIIISPERWKSQAMRLANLHNSEGIPAVVLSAEQIYNEFSSGRFDPEGIRKCLKMYYDRGLKAGQPLKYALLFGRGVYDNRQLSVECKNISYPLLPTWQSEESLNDATSYTTDDYYAILSDRDTLSIAVGRICITSAQDAENIVDKIINYANNPKPGEWKTKALMLADDGDDGCHLRYAENMIGRMKESGGQDVTFSKIYLDAFKKSNGTFPDARKKLEAELNNGVGWWTFIGHAGQTSLTADKLMTYNDILNLNLSIPPAALAFTCDFLRCDNNEISGGEMLLNNRNGGVIAAISATRPVNMHQNGELASAFGSLIYNKDLTIGEIFQRAKNRCQYDNKLRYVLLGDPAVKIAAIKNRVIVNMINDVKISDDTQPTVGAMSRITVEGAVLTDGDFNGTLTIKLYDAETTVTTNGNTDVFDTEGQLLYIGTDTVVNGIFNTTAIIPAEISDNYRNATMKLYAIDKHSGIEASGLETRFYIYGKGDGIVDTVKPVIDSFYLNRPAFRSGDIVNSSPTVYITVTDDTAIDISSSSNDNRMILKLDGKPLSGIMLYYSNGRIVYPLHELEDGHHSLAFEVSDIAGNHTSQIIEFVTQAGLNPEILAIYTDSQPVIDKANFYIEYNRPTEMVDVTLHIFDIRGNLVWESSRQCRGDSFKSNPLTWNLTDRSHRRVNRGIYIYRLNIRELSGSHSISRAAKIAVSN
ncbi:MAG: type IX secretion system sortase PorU [Muribaculaceae bacterium]|nr:type IX secretion system sortase PorU [Muribaculaceae bacterium]